MGNLTKKIELFDYKELKEKISCKIEISNDLKLEQTKDDLTIWTIIQVPVCNDDMGLAEIPTKELSKPIHYFSKIPQEYLQYCKENIILKID